jgi:hypothetical protein
LQVAISLDAALAFIMLQSQPSRETPYPTATLVVAGNTKV